MCLSSLAEELGADCTPIEFTLSTVSETEKRKGQQLSLDVVGVATGKGVRLDKVWTADCLPVATESIPTNADVQQWSHLKGINIADLVDKKVQFSLAVTLLKPFAPLKYGRERRINLMLPGGAKKSCPL